MAKSKDVWEFGDFQTPPELSRAILQLIGRTGLRPDCVLEPTCGQGAFLVAAAEQFPRAGLFGLEINAAHLAIAEARLGPLGRNIRLEHGDFFTTDWQPLLDACPGQWLIVGNPPWVTNAELGLLQSENLPTKTNFQGLSGFDALTGKSNFDISEWMLLRYLDWLEHRGGSLAVLVKTAVARKILAQAWKRRYPLTSAAIYKIDAMQHFGAAVDACLFVCSVNAVPDDYECRIFEDLSEDADSRTMGYRDGFLVHDLNRYASTRDLIGPDEHYVWRSGVKHDCSSVMEFRVEGHSLANGLREVVTLERDYLYPMMKSSDVNREARPGRKFMLVPQRSIGEDTLNIRNSAPQTWAYLKDHANALDGRSSSIYRNRPQFSVFGVGDYTFAPWKVAISGFYKSLRFSIVGPWDGKPVVFDDTVYFLPAQSEAEATFLAALMNSAPAQAFLGSMVFWENKRPITVDLLRRLSLKKTAHRLGCDDQYAAFATASGGASEPLFSAA